MKTPDYVLTDPVELPDGRGGSIKLEQGAFVRPVEYAYVPKHVKDDERWTRFSIDTYLYCYTPKGFMPIDKSIVRKV